jgi:hypothetical protein
MEEEAAMTDVAQHKRTLETSDTTVNDPSTISVVHLVFSNGFNKNRIHRRLGKDDFVDCDSTERNLGMTSCGRQ